MMMDINVSYAVYFVFNVFFPSSQLPQLSSISPLEVACYPPSLDIALQLRYKGYCATPVQQDNNQVDCSLDNACTTECTTGVCVGTILIEQCSEATRSVGGGCYSC